MIAQADPGRRGDAEEMETRAAALGVRLRFVPTEAALGPEMARE